MLLVEKMEPNMHGKADHDDEEETLSFCEFSMNSDADTWEDSSRSESHNSSSFKSSKGDDYFEFFSGELTTGTSTIPYAPPENIIFCGKLISYRHPISENTKKMETIKLKNHKKRRVFRWKWNLTSSHKTKTSSKNAPNSTGAKKGTSQSYKPLTAPERYSDNVRRKRSKEHDSTVHKMPFSFTSNGKSSKWYLFLFGITKFRTDMGLKDMKTRQSRRRSSSFSLFKLENEDSGNNNENACMTRSKGFWTVLIRALSCVGDHHATAVVKSYV